MSNQYNAKWSKEEDAIVKRYHDTLTYEEIADEIKKQLGIARSWGAVAARANKKLGLKNKENSGCCKIGNNINHRDHPIGTERVFNHLVYVKVDNRVLGYQGKRFNISNNPNWKRKDYIVWENAGNQPIDGKHDLLIHLDGDYKNCNIENLYKIDRKINFMISKNNWHFSDKESLLTAIKYAELFYALKGEEQ